MLTRLSERMAPGGRRHVLASGLGNEQFVEEGLERGPAAAGEFIDEILGRCVHLLCLFG